MPIDKKLIDQLPEARGYHRREWAAQTTHQGRAGTGAGSRDDRACYETHDPAGQHQGNPRNGKSRKTLQGDFGELELEMPRDRQATLEPKIVRKRQTRWTGFDDPREIQGHLEEIYGLKFCPH